MKRNPDVENLSLFYVVQYKDSDGELISDELIPDGANVLVKKENLEDYIEKRIVYMIEKSQLFINEMKNGLFEVSYYFFLILDYSI
jgi:hypothetical protein